MSWSKESTLLRTALAICFLGCLNVACSDSNNSWNIFAKENPRKVEPANDTTATSTQPPKNDAVAKQDKAGDAGGETDATAADRGDPQRIQQYAANLSPSNRNANQNTGIVSNDTATVRANNTTPNNANSDMSPVRMASVGDRGNNGGSTPITNDTAPPPTRSNTRPSGANSAATADSSSVTSITPVRPASSLDAANDVDTRPKFVDNDQLAMRSTNAAPQNTTPPSNTNNATTGAPKISAVTVESSKTNNTTAAPINNINTDNAAATNDPENEAQRLEIEEQQAKVETDPTNIQALFKLRMLYLLSGREADAFAPIDGIPTATQDIVLAQLRSFDAARTVSINDPATSANAQLEAMRNLQEKLREQADLQVPKVVLCTEIVAFGKYTPFASTDFEAGYDHDVVLYVEVDNFKSEQTAGGQYRTKFAARVSMLSKDGEQLSTFVEEPNIEDINRRPRRDFFMSFGPFTIPGVFPAGEYVIKVQVDDLLANKTNSNKTTFRLVP